MLARQPGSAWRLIRDCLPAFQLEQDLPSHTGRLFVGRGGRQLATPFSTSIEDPNEHVPLRDDETGTQQSISEPPVEASSLNASILANVGVDDRDQEESYGVSKEEQRIVRTSILGVPNAGKSTLINRLVGCRISAVSTKTNTTITPLLGQFTQENTQVLLYDTPGVADSQHRPMSHSPRGRRIDSAWKIAHDCDIALMVVDAYRQADSTDPRVRRVVEEYRENFRQTKPPPLALILNKMDKFEDHMNHRIKYMTTDFESLQEIDQTFLVSAANGMGIQELKDYLISRSSPGEWLLHPKQPTDRRVQDIACELVREKIFHFLRQELPYIMQMNCTGYSVIEPTGIRIFRISISTPSENTRRMLIGRKGEVIGRITDTATRDLSEIFGCKVHLFLKVAAE